MSAWGNKVDPYVGSVTVTDGGTLYAEGATISFTGGGGTGAAATAVAVDGVITEINVTDGGTGYTTVPTVVITAVNGGSGATATAVLADDMPKFLTAAEKAETTGYKADADTTLIPHVGWVKSVDKGAGPVTAVAVNTGGSGYTSATAVITSATGTGAVLDVTVTADAVTAITVVEGGSGYKAGDTVTITGQEGFAGVAATATATITNRVINEPIVAMGSMVD